MEPGCTTIELSWHHGAFIATFISRETMRTAHSAYVFMGHVWSPSHML
jgi:hypothetical protein